MDSLSNSLLQKVEERGCYSIPFRSRASFQPGTTLTIKGSTVKGSQRIDIDFYTTGTSFDGGDLPFHLTVRFFYNGIALNTFKDNHWFTEKQKESPIKCGEPFEIQISAITDRFIIHINKEYFNEYEYILPLNEIRNIAIGGDIALNCVAWNNESISSGRDSVEKKKPFGRDSVHVNIEKIYDAYDRDILPQLEKKENILSSCERLLLRKRKKTRSIQHRPKSNVICVLMVNAETTPMPEELAAQERRRDARLNSQTNSNESSSENFTPPSEFIYKENEDGIYECLDVFLTHYFKHIKSEFGHLQNDEDIISNYSKIWPLFLIASCEVKSNTFGNFAWRKNRRNFGIRGIEVIEVPEGLPNALGLALHSWQQTFFKEKQTYSIPYIIGNLMKQEMSEGTKQNTRLITPEIIQSYKLYGLIKSSVPINDPPTMLEYYEFIRWHFDFFPQVPRINLIEQKQINQNHESNL